MLFCQGQKTFDGGDYYTYSTVDSAALPWEYLSERNLFADFVLNSRPVLFKVAGLIRECDSKEKAEQIYTYFQIILSNLDSKYYVKFEKLTSTFASMRAAMFQKQRFASLPDIIYKNKNRERILSSEKHGFGDVLDMIYNLYSIFPIWFDPNENKKDFIISLLNPYFSNLTQSYESLQDDNDIAKFKNNARKLVVAIADAISETTMFYGVTTPYKNIHRKLFHVKDPKGFAQSFRYDINNIYLKNSLVSSDTTNFNKKHNLKDNIAASKFIKDHHPDDKEKIFDGICNTALAQTKEQPTMNQPDVLSVIEQTVSSDQFSSNRDSFVRMFRLLKPQLEYLMGTYRGAILNKEQYTADFSSETNINFARIFNDIAEILKDNTELENTYFDKDSILSDEETARTTSISSILASLEELSSLQAQSDVSNERANIDARIFSILKKIYGFLFMAAVDYGIKPEDIYTTSWQAFINSVSEENNADNSAAQTTSAESGQEESDNSLGNIDIKKRKLLYIRSAAAYYVVETLCTKQDEPDTKAIAKMYNSIIENGNDSSFDIFESYDKFASKSFNQMWDSREYLTDIRRLEVLHSLYPQGMIRSSKDDPCGNFTSVDLCNNSTPVCRFDGSSQKCRGTYWGAVDLWGNRSRFCNEEKGKKHVGCFPGLKPAQKRPLPDFMKSVD